MNRDNCKLRITRTSHRPSGRIWFAVAMMIVAVVVLTGCAGSSAAAVDSGAGTTADVVAGAPGMVAEAKYGSAPNLEGQSSSSDVDAKAIVAAQEAVLEGIYDRTLPAVVHIRVTEKVVQQPQTSMVPDIPGFPFNFGPSSPTTPVPQEFYRRGEASGFLWDSEGHIVTNHHVVDGADQVTVEFADGTQLDAEVLGSDPDSDLAVLHVNLPEGKLSKVELGDSDALKVGQMAIAIGNPFGQEFTMTSGIVSALGRTISSSNSAFSIPEVIQTDAAINPGNSGGPLLDSDGQVIGINTQIISDSGSSAGIGFAVPINTAKRVIPVLISDGSYAYAWLGIKGGTLTPNVTDLMNLPEGTRGALVIEVTKDSPADQAGLHGSDKTLTEAGQDYPLGGDVIVSIDGTPVKEMNDLISYLVDNNRPGDIVTLGIIRGQGEPADVKVTLGARPDPDVQS